MGRDKCGYQNHHDGVKNSIGHRGVAHGVASKNTGAAVSGSNSHMRNKLGPGPGGVIPGSQAKG